MKKLFSLIRASFSEGMDLFKLNTNSKSKYVKVIIPIMLFGLVMFSVGWYAYQFAEPLHEFNMTFIMLSMFIMFVSVFSFMEGIYKSQGILFDSKDNNLLFSLPIKKKNILFLRIFKLLTFQMLFGLIFMLPAYVVYVYFEHPGINFYFISILYLVLIPVIPTIVSSIIGYLVKTLSSRFKAKKIMQTILTCVAVGIIMLVSMKLDSFLENIVEKASSINDILCKVYYPIGAYVELIDKFDVIVFIKVLLLHIVPLILFVYLGSFYYFKIISKSSEVGLVRNKSSYSVSVHSKMSGLVSKELSKFFSSPVYIMNTLFGILLLFGTTIWMAIKGIDSLFPTEMFDFDVIGYLPAVYCGLVLFSAFSITITASSVSLEGSSFNITKSLPLKTNYIFVSKILASMLVSLPFMLISDILFIVRFKIKIGYCILILLLTISVTLFTAVAGLLINLRFPKMKFSNETEVVKQSTSAMLAVLMGFGLFFICVMIMIKFYKHLYLVLWLMEFVFILITIGLALILNSYGNRKWREINV